MLLQVRVPTIRAMVRAGAFDAATVEQGGHIGGGGWIRIDAEAVLPLLQSDIARGIWRRTCLNGEPFPGWPRNLGRNSTPPSLTEMLHELAKRERGRPCFAHSPGSEPRSHHAPPAGSS